MLFNPPKFEEDEAFIAWRDGADYQSIFYRLIYEATPETYEVLSFCYHVLEDSRVSNSAPSDLVREITRIIGDNQLRLDEKKKSIQNLMEKNPSIRTTLPSWKYDVAVL